MNDTVSSVITDLRLPLPHRAKVSASRKTAQTRRGREGGREDLIYFRELMEI